MFFIYILPQNRKLYLTILPQKGKKKTCKRNDLLCGKKKKEEREDLVFLIMNIQVW